MNLTDLSEVLRDRAGLADSSHEARMAGVRARVSATRRRRAAAGAAGVVLVLLGIVFALLPRIEQSEPAVPPRSLPEYQDGTRLVAQAWGDLPTTSATVRFVPKSMDLLLFTECKTSPRVQVAISLTVNGHPFTERGGCGGSRRLLDPSRYGVVPGQSAVVIVTVDGTLGPAESGPPPLLPAPASGTFAIGIGEPVPVSEYPFPPRPQTLATFSPMLPEPTIELLPDQADPTRQKDFTVEWPGYNQMVASSNTPGRIRVLVNDVVVLDFSHWSYVASSSLIMPTDWRDYGLDLARGQTVKITVIPERVTGDWKVTLAPR